MGEWTKAKWEEWQTENMRLLSEGWELGSDFMVNGSVREWAIKDGIEIDRTPECWKEEQK